MKKGLKTSALHGLAIALLFCAGCPVVHAKQPPAVAPAPLPDIATTQWVLLLPNAGPVQVTGVANFDGAGSGPGNMMYPAPNAVGLLAAVVTHGVIQGAKKRKEHDRIQQAADKVLEPYQATFSGMSNRGVAMASLARTPFGDRKTLASEPVSQAGTWRISATPAFSLTQDQRAFIIDNAIVLFAPGSTTPSHKTSVRVISQPRAGDDPASMWTADDASELKEEWGFLFAESIEVALRALSSMSGNDPATPFATLRYAEGGAERIERAQPLYEACGRIVLKTLRGKLMSVPAKLPPDANEGAANCPAPR